MNFWIYHEYFSMKKVRRQIYQQESKHTKDDNIILAASLNQLSVTDQILKKN